MSTSASISNPAKITSSNICCSHGFSSVCQFSPSHFLSVSDLTRQANCAEPAACQVQHIDTSWGKKVNLCWQMLTTALPAWLNPRHLRWEGGETTSLQREMRTNCQPHSETESEEECEKVTPYMCILPQLLSFFQSNIIFSFMSCGPGASRYIDQRWLMLFRQCIRSQAFGAHSTKSTASSAETPICGVLSIP